MHFLKNSARTTKIFEISQFANANFFDFWLEIAWEISFFGQKSA